MLINREKQYYALKDLFGEVFAGAVRGTGETFKPMLLTLLGTCVPRVLWVLLVVPDHRTMTAIVASYPVSWLLTSAFFVVFYRSFKEKRL
jgi:Na+-driven multidrug efflux pump